MLSDAVGIGDLHIPPGKASPLQRIARIGAEDQAAWIYWLLKAVLPQLPQDLLASYPAWNLIKGVRMGRW
jgi:hypothetical protein